MNKWEYATEFLRALPRPFCACVAMLAIAVIAVDRIPVEGYVWGVLSAPVLWYLTERTITKERK